MPIQQLRINISNNDTIFHSILSTHDKSWNSDHLTCVYLSVSPQGIRDEVDDETRLYHTLFNETKYVKDIRPFQSNTQMAVSIKIGITRINDLVRLYIIHAF